MHQPHVSFTLGYGPVSPSMKQATKNHVFPAHLRVRGAEAAEHEFEESGLDRMTRSGSGPKSAAQEDTGLPPGWFLPETQPRKRVSS